MNNFDKAMELLCQMQDRELAEKHEKERAELRLKQYKMAEMLSDLTKKYPDMEKEFMQCFEIRRGKKDTQDYQDRLV
jgi:hypothetical protein